MSQWRARLLVDLLMRSATAAGGFAMVLARGDDHGGAILVQCCDRGTDGPLLERQFDGVWRSVGPAAEGPAEDPSEDPSEARRAYVARRRAVDPDLWLIELDIAEAPQFVAELTAGA